MFQSQHHCFEKLVTVECLTLAQFHKTPSSWTFWDVSWCHKCLKPHATYWVSPSIWALISACPMPPSAQSCTPAEPEFVTHSDTFSGASPLIKQMVTWTGKCLTSSYRNKTTNKSKTLHTCISDMWYFSTVSKQDGLHLLCHFYFVWKSYRVSQWKKTFWRKKSKFWLFSWNLTFWWGQYHVPISQKSLRSKAQISRKTVEISPQES